MFFADSGNHRNVFGGFRETRRVTGLQAFHNFTREIERIKKWNWAGRRLWRLVRVAVIISNAVERLRLCIHNQNRPAIVPLNMSEESIGSFLRWNDRPIKCAVKKKLTTNISSSHSTARTISFLKYLKLVMKKYQMVDDRGIRLLLQRHRFKTHYRHYGKKVILPQGKVQLKWG